MHRVARGSTVLWHRLSVRRKSVKPDDIIDIDLISVETPKSVENQSKDQFWDLESDALVKQEVRVSVAYFQMNLNFRKVTSSTID